MLSRFIYMLSVLVLVTGCATGGPASYGTSYDNGRSHCETCGVVEDVNRITAREDGIGFGAVIGAVVGGALCNQVGDGSGQDAATVAGAVGGAVAGHHIEKSQRATQPAWEVIVRLDDGRVARVVQAENPYVREGDRVYIENDLVYRS